MPGGFEDRTQRQSLLREMDSAPQRSAHVPVPNPRYANADNVARRGARLGFAELLAAAFVGRDPATYVEAMRSAAADEWTEALLHLSLVRPRNPHKTTTQQEHMTSKDAHVK